MIESLKDLEKLLRLCRKQGVTEIKLGTVEFKLGELPNSETKSSTASQEDGSFEDPYANFPQDELTPAQLTHYASGGRPEDDPELLKQIKQ